MTSKPVPKSVPGWEAALEDIPLGVFTYDFSNDELRANGVFYAITGISPETGLRAHTGNVSSDELARMRRLYAPERPNEYFQHDFTYRHPDGTSRTFRVTGRLHWPLASCSLADVSGHNAENSVSINRNTLKTNLFEHLPIGMLVIDPVTHRVEQANAYAARVYGGTVEELAGKRCHHLICPHQEATCPIVEFSLVEDRSAILTKSGILLDVTKTVIPVQVGGEMKILECFVDISQLARKEDQLTRMTERLKLAAKAGGIGIWDYDIKTGSEVWDDQMYRIYDTSRRESENGLDIWKARVHPEDRDRIAGKFSEAVKNHSDYESEFRIVRTDGTVRTIRSMGMIQRNKMGNPVHLIGVNWDITEQKETEANLIRYNMEMEAAGMRANELMLRAETANVAKSAFLATISHEIRTPLNGIIGMSGLLLDTKLDETQLQYVELVRSGGTHLLELLNQLLDHSKIEANKMMLETVTMKVSAVVEESIMLVAGQARLKGLEIHSRVSPDVPETLNGDPGRLRQILVNLLGNAVKFTETGVVYVSVELKENRKTNVLLKFSIRDTGIGIPLEKQDVLFQPFSQVDSSKTRKHGGTGLGLAISKQLAELMSGEIGVISEEGTGSTFWFTAELEKAGNEAAVEPAAAEKKNGLPAPKERKQPNYPTFRLPEGAPIKALLAEDNPTNRLVAEKLLEKCGVSVDSVANGAEALESLGRIPYNLLFIDCNMPVMDGYEAAREIRFMEESSDSANPDKRPHLPIIAITAHIAEEEHKKCFEAGMDDIIVKPLDIDKLAAMIERYAVHPADRRLFDPSALALRLNNDTELQIRLVFAFIEDGTKKMSDLERAITEGDLERTRHLAHSLQGAALNIGSKRLAKEANGIETDIREKSTDKIVEKFSAMQNTFTQLKNELHKIVPGGNA